MIKGSAAFAEPTVLPEPWDAADGDNIGVYVIATAPTHANPNRRRYSITTTVRAIVTTSGVSRSCANPS